MNPISGIRTFTTMPFPRLDSSEESQKKIERNIEQALYSKNGQELYFDLNELVTEASGSTLDPTSISRLIQQGFIDSESFSILLNIIPEASFPSLFEAMIDHLSHIRNSLPSLRSCLSLAKDRRVEVNSDFLRNHIEYRPYINGAIFSTLIQFGNFDYRMLERLVQNMFLRATDKLDFPFHAIRDYLSFVDERQLSLSLNFVHMFAIKLFRKALRVSNPLSYLIELHKLYIEMPLFIPQSFLLQFIQNWIEESPLDCETFKTFLDYFPSTKDKKRLFYFALPRVYRQKDPQFSLTDLFNLSREMGFTLQEDFLINLFRENPNNDLESFQQLLSSNNFSLNTLQTLFQTMLIKMTNSRRQNFLWINIRDLQNLRNIALEHRLWIDPLFLEGIASGWMNQNATANFIPAFLGFFPENNLSQHLQSLLEIASLARKPMSYVLTLFDFIRERQIPVPTNIVLHAFQTLVARLERNPHILTILREEALRRGIEIPEPREPPLPHIMQPLEALAADPQNTHYASVHASTAASALRLLQRYPNLSSRNLIRNIRSFCRNTLDASERAINAINYILENSDWLEPISNLSLPTVLCLVWQGALDQTCIVNGDPTNVDEDLEERKRNVLIALTDCSFFNEEHRCWEFFCLPGIFNNLVSALDLTHPDVKIDRITTPAIFTEIVFYQARSFFNAKSEEEQRQIRSDDTIRNHFLEELRAYLNRDEELVRARSYIQIDWQEVLNNLENIDF